MNTEQVKVIEFVDDRGIIGTILDDGVSANLQINYSNRSSRTITRDRYLRCKHELNKLISYITPYEFIGRKYPDKTKKHVCEVIKVEHQREKYVRSMVRVKWDTGIESVHYLRKIIEYKISYDRAILSPYVDKVIIVRTATTPVGGYFKPPEGINHIHTYDSSLAKWRAMMLRCYGKGQERAYNDVEVDQRWFNFYEFNKWYEQRYHPGWVLDKDLKHGTNYSPETCILIPQKLNAMLITRAGDNKYPIGIYKTKLPERTPYVAALGVQGGRINLGSYNDIIDGFIMVKILKEYVVYRLAFEVLKDEPYNEHIEEILSLCKSFELLDKRPNGFTREYLIEHLQKETNSSETDYQTLKDLFMKKHKEFFNTKKELANKLIEKELEYYRRP